MLLKGIQFDNWRSIFIWWGYRLVTLTDELIKKDRMKEFNNILRGMMYICISLILHINVILKPIIFLIGIILIGFYGFSLVCRHKYVYRCDYIKEINEEKLDIEKTYKEFVGKVVGKSTRESYINKLLVKNRNKKIREITSSVLLIAIFCVVFEREWYMILVIFGALTIIGDNVFSLITEHKYGEIHGYNLIKEDLKNEIKNEFLSFMLIFKI